MFTWLGSKLTDILGSYVLGVVSALVAAIAPLALTALTIWVLLYGWAVLRGEASGSASVFLWKVTKIGLVFAFALQSSFYVTNVSNSANGLATGMATTFLPDGSPGDTVTSPYTLLDQFNDDASKQVSDIMKDAGITRLDLLLAACVFSIGSVAFLCVAVFVVTLSQVFLTFVIGVGPLFVLCLAWKPTQRFFDSWLSMLLNAVVLTWFAFFALGLSSFLGTQMFAAIEAGGGFLGPTLNVLGEATRYCVLMIVMAIICFQAPSLASALTGGVAVQQGVQMIQNSLMVAGLRGARNAPHAPPGGAAGGVIRAGLAMPFAGGRPGLGAGRAERQGMRTPAYRLAARRGLA